MDCLLLLTVSSQWHAVVGLAECTVFWPGSVDQTAHDSTEQSNSMVTHAVEAGRPTNNFGDHFI